MNLSGNNPCNLERQDVRFSPFPRMRPPESGSFAVTGRVADRGTDLFEPEQAQRVVEQMYWFSFDSGHGTGANGC